MHSHSYAHTTHAPVAGGPATLSWGRGWGAQGHTCCLGLWATGGRGPRLWLSYFFLVSVGSSPYPRVLVRHLTSGLCSWGLRRGSRMGK